MLSISQTEANDFQLFDRVVSPIMNGKFGDDKNFDLAACLIAFLEVAFTKRIMADGVYFT